MDDLVSLGGNDVRALTIDSKGTLWVGTLAGTGTFDGRTFTPFDLPETEPDYSRGVTSSRIVHSIIEDSRGRMWFATTGGVFVWDGTKLENISTADGLCGNAVNDIVEARDGSFWFATHHNGVCRLKDGEFTHLRPRGRRAGRRSLGPLHRWRRQHLVPDRTLRGVPVRRRILPTVRRRRRNAQPGRAVHLRGPRGADLGRRIPACTGTTATGSST
ncbi:MAG: hypothetical protein IPM94_08105 [bacterium]|nr:hypothetical protein [bacterium]